ncbi:MAG: TrmJ/YjtD family RNA methyltransferase [Myxococcota bacterium]
MDVTVVLVEPRFAANVGSVARAMANFGLHDLVLVNPAPGLLQHPQAQNLARSGTPVIERARTVATLEEALTHAHTVLGFTARGGKQRGDELQLEAAVSRLVTDAPARVAAVFGREDDGLRTGEMALCHWAVRIPTEEPCPSLNLSHAVALWAYELKRQRGATTSRNLAAAAPNDLRELQVHLQRVLTRVEFLRGNRAERMMGHIWRFVMRRTPDAREARILRGILRRTETYLHHPTRRSGSSDRSDEVHRP